MVARIVLSFLISTFALGARLDAADLVAIADGNFTSASTWGVVDTTSRALSNAGQTSALTTATLDSQAFAPGAITVSHVCLRLASRATGTPTNTLTVTLRNSTAGTDVASGVINVSDLAPAPGGMLEAGWFCIEFSSPPILSAATDYRVRTQLSSTSTSVVLARTTVAANDWQRLLVTTTTQAPAAGDDLHLPSMHVNSTNPATAQARTVTMDSTAATDYGAASTDQYLPAISISNRSTLAFGTTAATDYVLRVSGHIRTYRGGTFTMGTAASPIPRSSTAVLELDPASDGQFRLWTAEGGTRTAIGESRTSGKDVSQTILTANFTSGTSTATVADDTGWLAGDRVAIASTTQTPSQAEPLTLNATGTTSLSFSSNATATHLGSVLDQMQAEVILLTRNVEIRSATAANAILIENLAGSIIDDRWVSFRYSGHGFSTGTPAYRMEHLTTGSVNMSHVVIHDGEGAGILMSTTGAAFTLESVSLWNISQNINNYPLYVGQTMATTSVSNFWAVADSGGAGSIFFSNTSQLGTWHNIRSVGYSSGVAFQGPWDLSGFVATGTWVLHSTNQAGIHFSSNFRNLRLPTIISYRNAGQGGINFNGSVRSLTIDSLLVVGNVNGITIQNGVYVSGVRIGTLRASGDTAHAQGHAFNMQVTGTTSRFEAVIDSGTFGVSNGGLYTTHTTAMFTGGGSSVTLRADFQVVINGATTSDPVFQNNTTLATLGETSFVALQRSADGAHAVYTPLGIVAKETTTVDETPALSLTPLSATMKLQSNAGIAGRGFLVPVDTGDSVTVSVQVRKNATYNGAAPRLIVRANPSVGIAADTVIDTHSAAADVWETLGGSVAAATAAGVLEFFIDASGTAGAAFVDSWTATGGAALSGGGEHWLAGLPFTGTVPAGASGLDYWRGGLPFALASSGGGTPPPPLFDITGFIVP